jgi:hypothetical protein
VKVFLLLLAGDRREKSHPVSSEVLTKNKKAKGQTAFRPSPRGWYSLGDEMKDGPLIITVPNDSILETSEKGFHLLALI